jgi:hypothetical protein
LYPGEYDDPTLRRDHLKIIDDNYFGGKKAICVRRCTSKDLKPLDCKSYPYFPRINKEGKIEILKGRKCPLTKRDLLYHKRWLLKEWEPLLRDRRILEWLRHVKLVGYELEK